MLQEHDDGAYDLNVKRNEDRLRGQQLSKEFLVLSVDERSALQLLFRVLLAYVLLRHIHLHCRLLDNLDLFGQVGRQRLFANFMDGHRVVDDHFLFLLGN